MRSRATAVALALLAGCASLATPTGRHLVPGQSTEADVTAEMGKPVDTRTRPNGEKWLYYTNQPYGRANYVARLAPDGKMIAFENRLTDKTVATIEKGKQVKEGVRELLGPPYRAEWFPVVEREIWTYHMRTDGSSGQEMVLYVQFSSDGIVREVYEYSLESIRASGSTSM